MLYTSTTSYLSLSSYPYYITRISAPQCKLLCPDNLIEQFQQHIFHTASIEYQADSNQGDYQEADKF